MSGPVERRAFTDLEVERVRALTRCSFLPGLPVKSFARNLLGAINATPSPGVTEKQADLLSAYCWTYRRQIPVRLVPPKPKARA